jgi:NAD(P)-dependent dehydrogenase (short-subunit alcohol dehydrogenase family)
MSAGRRAAPLTRWSSPCPEFNGTGTTTQHHHRGFSETSFLFFSTQPSPEITMTIHQKIALVTGATRGIGLATTRQLAQAGVHVLLAGRSIETATKAAQTLRSEGLSVEPLALDVTIAASIAAAAAHVQATYGRLDILVNNAGVLLDAMDRKPSEQSLQVWRETFDTNVFALVEVTQAFLPLLKGAAAGRIVNLSSQLASFGLHTDPTSPVYDFKLPAYNASKSVVNAWTVHLAYELRGTSVKVNAVHPGYVMTDMNAGHGEIDAEAGAKTSVAMALLEASGPSGTFTHLGKTLPW